MSEIEIRKTVIKDTIWLRAFLDGKEVGSVSFFKLCTNKYQVCMLQVKEEYQRQGIGTALM